MQLYLSVKLNLFFGKQNKFKPRYYHLLSMFSFSLSLCSLVTKDLGNKLLLFLITCSVYISFVCGFEFFTNTFLFYCFYDLFTFILYVGVSVACVDGVWKCVTDARTDWKSRHCLKSLSLLWIKCEIKSNQISLSAFLIMAMRISIQ
jgi:hypothetical protein